MDENIVREGDHTRDLYFITSGKVSLVHRESYTFIADLHKDSSFGEIAFFSDAPRQVTAKAADYTETMTITLEDFLNSAT